MIILDGFGCIGFLFLITSPFFFIHSLRKVLKEKRSLSGNAMSELKEKNKDDIISS